MDPENPPKFSSFEDIISYAMSEEKDAHDFYVQASEEVHDPDLKKFLLKLAEMELEHYETLKNKLEEYKAHRFGMKGIMSSFGEGEI